MAVERDFELLDDYLSNRLEGTDKAAFEQKMQADPELQQEFKIQQNIAEGVRKARVTELKSMLNNIPVTPMNGGQTSMLIKASSFVVITGLVITGVYFFFLKEEAKVTEVTKDQVQTAQPAEQPTATPSPAEGEVKKEETPKTNTDKPAGKTESADKKPVESGTTSPVKKPSVKVYDPTKEQAEESIQKYEQEQLEIISKAFVTSSIEVEIEVADKKYTFHYMFQGGKLRLYGTFEKHLYEILEFISDDKRTVVLFYRSSYYLLDINKSTPTVLTPIRDRALLKKLSEYRGN